MEPQDIATLGALAGRIWNAHYRSIIAQAQIDFMLPRSYSAEALQEQQASGQRFLLAEMDGEMIGFLSFSDLAKIENLILRGKDSVEGGIFLHKFYLASECQGKGIGKKMFAELLRRVPEIQKIRLQVHRRNVNSWNFYKKIGFKIVCEADFDIGDGFQMNDYVMEKRC
jgi:RimJ/RimL family protein N-acetyltransferase